MKIVFEESNAKIWHNSYSPVIFTEIITLPGDDESFCRFNNKSSALLKIIRKSNVKAYGLMNMKSLSFSKLDLFIKYSKLFYITHFWSGMEFLAIVKPADRLASDSIRGICDSLRVEKTRKVKFFSCLEKARRELNTMQMNDLISDL